MTVDEAAKKWGIGYKTVYDYIHKGYIYNISVVDNVIILPDIPKPYIVRDKKLTASKIDIIICKTLENLQYLNAKILGKDDLVLEERLKALLNAEKIFAKVDNPSFKSTLDFSIASKMETKRNVEMNITPTLKNNVQVGGINTIIGG